MSPLGVNQCYKIYYKVNLAYFICYYYKIPACVEEPKTTTIMLC